MNKSRVEELLEQLNELEQNYGRVLAEQDSNYDPSGEVNARVFLLKQELSSLQVELIWDGHQYQISYNTREIT